MSKHAIILPDLGDFEQVDVVEVLVKVGDRVEAEQALAVLETDKASMEVPAPFAGVITALSIQAGDKVAPQAAIGEMDDEAATASPAPASASVSATAAAPAESTASASKAAPAPNAATASASAPADGVDLLVIGAGPAGYSAAFRAADLGLQVTLVERYPTLGGVCLNVGCIPSKALLHVAEVMEEAEHLSVTGVQFAAPQIDIDALRSHKENVIKKLTGGLAGMAKARKVKVVQGLAQFSGSHSVRVELADGGSEEIRFKQAIIAAGSQSVKLPFMPNEDERVMDSTGALALRDVPARLLIVGGGIIGLEMATVYASLGSQVDIVEMADTLMAGADKDLVKIWEKRNAKRFRRMMTGTKTVAAEALPEGIRVQFEGKNAPTEAQIYERVLVAVGRSPNGKKLNLEAAGVQVDERGFIPVDKQMRSNQPHIFAIGDIVGQPMLAHKGVHEGHVAAQAAAGQKSYFDARVIPAVAYTSPEVAWVGLSETQAQAQNIAFEKAVFPWAASGRAIANGCDFGMTKWLFDPQTHRVLGGAIVGPNAGDMIGEMALAIEMNAHISDVALTIHPHPTLGESIGMAAEVAEGSCTDLPPQKR